MFTPKEKALIVVAYYKGTADNDVLRGTKPEVSYGISIECTEKIMNELGLDIDFEEDFEAFMKELDVISAILTKEKEEENKFTHKNPVYCRICRIDYLDFCSIHCHIPDSWEVRDKKR